MSKIKTLKHSTTKHCLSRWIWIFRQKSRNFLSNPHVFTSFIPKTTSRVTWRNYQNKSRQLTRPARLLSPPTKPKPPELIKRKSSKPRAQRFPHPSENKLLRSSVTITFGQPQPHDSPFVHAISPKARPNQIRTSDREFPCEWFNKYFRSIMRKSKVFLSSPRKEQDKWLRVLQKHVFYLLVFFNLRSKLQAINHERPKVMSLKVSLFSPGFCLENWNRSVRGWTA